MRGGTLKEGRDYIYSLVVYYIYSTTKQLNTGFIDFKNEKKIWSQLNQNQEIECSET